MDNLEAGNGSESSDALDTNQAANAFAAALYPSEVAEDKPKTEPEAKVEGEAIEAKAETDPPAEDETTVTVKIDGKDVEIPLSELKLGYQRQADYTKKTMEASAEKKAASAETVKAQQERQAYGQKLAQIQTNLQGLIATQKGIDFNALARENPAEWAVQKEALEQRQAALVQVYAEQQRINAIQQAENAANFASHLAQQHETLVAKLPEWKDEAKAKADKTALAQYLINEGYTDADVSGISDAKAVILARKAMLYDQIISKAEAASKRVSTLPTKVLRSGGGENPANLDRRGAVFQRLNKSGKVEDAAAAFGLLLN